MIRPPTLGTIVRSAPSAAMVASFSDAKASDVTTAKRYPFAAHT